MLTLMGIGYSAFSSNLEISGTSSVSSSWDIAITGISDAKVEGLAEETHTPTWDRLTASMEADLYQKGDSVSYDVTIENRGTLDATLEDISQNVKSTNEAVRIMFTGYTKGQVLKSKSSQIVTVKIEYNPDFDGNAEEGSGEVSVTFNYTQYESNGTTIDGNAPQGKYLVTYNCDYSGGSDTPSILHNQYLSEGSAIDLTPQCTKAGYTFIGWNTDSNSTKPINSINVGNGNVTLYGIYKKTVTATYIKGNNISEIGKDKDSCDMYNKDVSCNIVLPSITPVSDYESLGWYNGNTKVGDTNGTYALNEDITFTSKAGKLEPYMMARDTTKAFWQSDYKDKISTVDILDNKNVPTDAVISWDVSDKQNKSVMAWFINDPDNAGMYKLYIGGNGGVYANEDSSYLFAGKNSNFNKVTEINLGNLDTSKVTNMYSMFRDCSSLISLDLSTFDTSNVINMTGMFSGCSSLTSLNLSNFNTSNVTNMTAMFNKCSGLTSLNVSKFDTSNVTNMSYMFSECSSLTSLDVSKFDTSNVTNMSCMFNKCSGLTSLDVSKFDTSNVTNMSYMFNKCSGLTSLSVNNFNTSNVTNMTAMFQRCSSLTSLDVSKFDTSKVIDMSYMFNNCSGLTSLSVNNFNTSKVTDMRSMFSNCSSLTELAVNDFDTRNVINMRGMFNNCFSLTSLNLNNFNTSKVTDMSAMFAGTTNNTTFENVTMNLIKIDGLENFDTSKVITMNAMFQYCSKLTSLNLNKWNTSNVTKMSGMFYNCSSLTSLNVSNFDTSKVTNMYAMFQRCSSLTSLDVSNFDTSKVTDMHSMFESCKELTKLILCSFTTSNVTNFDTIFGYTPNLKYVYVGPNWTTTNATTTDMFTGSGISSVTQSNNCEYDAEDISVSLNTTSTTNSITAVATAFADSGISKYEFSKDDGKTWIDNGTSNVYTFSNLKNIKAADTLKTNNVTSGDGLYVDSTETGRYVYRGANPNNYITLGTDTYRIIAVESDGTLKVIKNGSIGRKAFDTSKNARYSTISTDYCYATSASSYYGCKVWGSKTTTLDTNGKNVTQMPRDVNGTLYNLPDSEATLNTYLNNDWYNSLSSNVQNIVVSHMFNVGVTKRDETNLSNTISQEQTYKWKGKVGLMNPSDYVKASTNSACTSANAYYATSSCYKNSDTHNWIYAGPAAESASWTIAPYSGYDAYTVFFVDSGGTLTGSSANGSYGAAPVLYLSSDISLEGDGTSNSPYTVETSFPIKVRATSKIGKIKESDKVDTKLKEISAPTFSESETSSGKNVIITYPSGCGSTYTCSYSKDSGDFVTVTSNPTISFTGSGNVVTKVSDGTNTVSSSYTVKVEISTSDLESLVVTSGDGLYADSTETGRYVYRGTNPNNYITLGTDTYRIISVESDNTLKVIKNGSIGNKTIDTSNTRYSTNSTDYCNSKRGCKVWGSKTTMLDTNGKNVTQMPREVGGTLYNLPDKEASLNAYLNNDWYNSLSSNVKNLIVSHMFNVGVTKHNETSLSNTILQEAAYKWKGKVGLMNPSEYVKASTYSACTSVNAYFDNSECYRYSKVYNWMFVGPMAESLSWTIAPYSSSSAGSVFRVLSGGSFYYNNASYSYGVAPVFYLSSDITLSGKGTETEPYQLLAE